ncbi:lipoyl(octanoyl) transferase LipB [soil metagenome]
MDYRAALDRQRDVLERVIAARGSLDAEAGTNARGNVPSRSVGVLVLGEHPPVITISARRGAAAHLLASAAVLAERGVAVEQTDRGGDITYHGPGQLVAYPILDLNALGLRLHDYVRALEDVIIATCAHFGIAARREAGATGVWVGPGAGSKIAAIGVRIRHWVSMHGLALNVAPRLEDFDLIVPCGLAGRSVTSMERELGAAPPMHAVKRVLGEEFAALVAARKTPATRREAGSHEATSG